MLIVLACGSSAAHAAMYSEQDRRWPEGTVHYRFHDSLPENLRVAVDKAAKEFNKHSARTGVSIFRSTHLDSKYVTIYPTTGVSRVSHVGYHAQEQQFMWLNTSVAIWQVAVHEFGHVIGLHHEHQRCERDLWLDVPDPGGAMTRQCRLPTVERYNPMSIMHYSESELSAFGASLRPGHSAPAKSLHPGLVESDLRTIATMYRPNGTFALVSIMHAKCLEAPARDDGTPVRMWTCDHATPNQKWTYNAASGELEVDDAKCLDGSLARALEPVVIRGCHGGSQQKWDIGEYGQLVLRTIKDDGGRPLCAEIRRWDRSDGAQLMLQYCHRSDNQQWRRHPAGWRVAASTVSLVSDLIPANVADGPQPSKCADAPSAQTGTQLHLWDCQGRFHDNQRFSRTVARELRVHYKCIDGHNGQVGDPVRVWECNGAANQRWELTSIGTLRGVNGLCLKAAEARSTNGTPLQLATCTDSPSLRWSTRDPG